MQKHPKKIKMVSEIIERNKKKTSNKPKMNEQQQLKTRLKKQCQKTKLEEYEAKDKKQKA